MLREIKNITFNSALTHAYSKPSASGSSTGMAEPREDPAVIGDSKPHGAPTPRIKRVRIRVWRWPLDLSRRTKSLVEWRWPLELSGRTKFLIGLVGVRDRGIAARGRRWFSRAWQRRLPAWLGPVEASPAEASCRRAASSRPFPRGRREMQPRRDSRLRARVRLSSRARCDR